MSGKHYRLLVALTVCLMAYTIQVKAQATNMSVYIPLVPWNRILYPEGVYEPFAVGLPGTHRHTFDLMFLNYTSPANYEIECDIMRSDGSHMALSKVTPDSNGVVEVLSYTLLPGDPIDKHTPWEVINCSLKSDAGVVVFNTTSAYGSPLEKRIHVHENTWTRFNTIDDDAYLAGQCFLGLTKRYFNNSLQCDYAGDVAFAVAMSRGMNVEGDCQDNVDGAEQNGDVDCADIYCQGIVYSCKAHTYLGDPFLGSCRNGLCWERKTFAGHTITYYYTRYIRNGGTLKFRFNGGRYSTRKPISYAITGLAGYSGYGSYAAQGAHKPSTEYMTQGSYALEDSGGYIGDIDFVMYLRPEGVRYGWNTLNVYIIHYGQDLLIENIPFYVSDSAPSNWDESDEMSSIINDPCGDDLDNDLSYVADCADSNCNGELSGDDCTGGNAYCEYGIERTCHDCFDNDADVWMDCVDRNCDGRAGNYLDLSDLCEHGCEGCELNYPSHCTDGFDNDADGYVDCADVSLCWGRGGDSVTMPCPSNEGNSPAWCGDGQDNDFDGLSDCMDYDCAGVQYMGGYLCPFNETHTAQGVFMPQWCFDNVDNDLDNPDR
jgi:hypothetical protein